MFASNLGEKVEAIAFALKFPPTSGSFAVIVQVILAGIFVAALLINLIANEHTADRVEQREVELKFVNQSASQVKGILPLITDKPTAKKVERLYDVLYGSPVKSNQTVRPIEEEIMRELNQLDHVASQSDWAQVEQLATKLTRLADERNRKLM
jgi:hypothetical protein